MASTSSMMAMSTSSVADVDAVLWSGCFDHVDGRDAGVGEHGARLFLAPRGAQPRAALGEGHGHAVQHADAVDVRGEGVAEVALEPRGRARLEHEIDAVRRESPGDPVQDG